MNNEAICAIILNRFQSFSTECVVFEILTMNTSTTLSDNPCVRCGTERIIKKTWKEKVTTYFGTSDVVHTETACPDKACQKILDEKFAKERERLDLMQAAKEERLRVAKEGRLKAKS